MSGQSAALRRLILGLADSKRLMGIRYSDWLLGAPSLETGIACSSMAQDEWGHARLLYAMLKELDEDPTPVEYDRSDEEYTSVDALDEGSEDWAGLIVSSAVVDEALRVRLEAFAESDFALARSRVPKMLAEEELHRDFGRAWFKRLAEGDDDSRAAVRRQTEAVLPRTLAWLVCDDEVGQALVAEGMSPPAAAVRARYEERMAPLLSLLSLAMPEPDTAGWDSVRGRGPGHPVGDALERARGDRNRSLLVE